MNYNYRDLIRKVGENCVREQDATHVLVGEEKKLVINNQNMTTFWEEYCNLVYMEADVNETCLNLAEMVINEIPLMQDFLFRFKVEEGDLEDWCPYENDLIGSIALLYQNVLKEYYNIIDDNQLIVVVLESSGYWFESKDVVVMRMRLQFPNTKIEVTAQTGFIKTEILNQLRKKNIVGKFVLQPLDSWEKMMQKNNCMLYGGCVKGELKMKLIAIWGKLTERMIENGEINDDNNDMKVKDVFDLNKHSQVYRGIVDTRIFRKEIQYEYWLPMFLSIHYCSNVQLIKENMEKKAIKYTEVKDDHIFGERVKKDIDDNEDEIMLAVIFLDMIAPKRFMQESYWLDIGRGLYKHDEGLQLWIRYTLNSAKGIEILPYFFKKIVGETTEGNNEAIITQACNHKFDTFTSTRITVKTLAEFASEDNYNMYEEWHKKWCLEAMELSLDTGDVGLAIALYRFNWLKYVYDNSNNKWYYHRSYGWEETSKGLLLRKDISNRFKKKYEQVVADLSNKQFLSNDDTKNMNTTVKKVNAVIAKLCDSTKKSKILLEAQEHFSIDRFNTFLDDNYDLMGVKNGVLEIIDNDIVFRKMKPEDFISISMGVPFHTYFNNDHPLVIECMKWMSQMFEEDLMEHFLKFSASVLRRRNNDKIFPIFTGNGNNSKSMVIKLFTLTFGSYAIKVPVAIFSEKFVASGNASPQTARFAHRAIGFADEADDSMPINKNSIKKYTGNDSFFTRKLNENGGDIELSIKICVITNDIPDIPDPDDAVKRRVKIIPFLSEWVPEDRAPKTEEEQMKQRKFKMDTSFEKRIPLLASAFLWILTQYYPKYCKEGLVDPPSVIEHTRQYWEENDIYGKFEADNITETYTPDGERDLEPKVTMNELYAEFKTWFRSSYPTSKLPNRDVVKAAYQKKWGRCGADGWKGISLPQANNEFEILPFQN